MALTVTGITASKDKDLPGKGMFTSYKLNVRDETGKEHAGVELFQRKDSVPPVEGKTYENWSVESGEYGPKVKKAPGVGGFGGPRQRDPKETAAIQRQHSQSAAVEFLKAKIAAGALEEFPGMDKFRILVDWFQRDIEWGVRLASNPGYGQPQKVKDPPKKPAAASDVPNDAEGFTHPSTPAPKEWAA